MQNFASQLETNLYIVQLINIKPFFTKNTIKNQLELM